MALAKKNIFALLLLSFALLLQTPALYGESRKAGKSEAGEQSGKVDINRASQEELESLPGIGPATAKKIIDLRPFRSAKDLERAGLSDSEIAKLRGKVKVSRASHERASSDNSGGKKSADDESAPKRQKKDEVAASSDSSQSAGKKVDLNSASQQELEALPGVGPSTAEKIIAGRPYNSKAQLKNSGIPESTIEKIYPLVVAHRADNSVSERNDQTLPRPPSRESTNDGNDAEGTSARGLPQSDPDSEQEPPVAGSAQTPPEKGMVWVNTDSGIFHREGDQWYGKTKQGKFMTEEEALKTGFREAKHK